MLCLAEVAEVAEKEYPSENYILINELLSGVDEFMNINIREIEVKNDPFLKLTIRRTNTSELLIALISYKDGCLIYNPGMMMMIDCKNKVVSATRYKNPHMRLTQDSFITVEQKHENINVRGDLDNILKQFLIFLKHQNYFIKVQVKIDKLKLNVK